MRTEGRALQGARPSTPTSACQQQSLVMPQSARLLNYRQGDREG
jgi:hypothetical protein